MYSIPICIPIIHGILRTNMANKMWRIFVKQIHCEPEVVDPCWSATRGGWQFGHFAPQPISERWFDHPTFETKNILKPRRGRMWWIWWSWWNMMIISLNISRVSDESSVIPSWIETLKPVPSFSIRHYPLVNKHRPCQIGVGRLVSIKNGWFSGSMFIYQRVCRHFVVVFFFFHPAPFRPQPTPTPARR